MDSETYLFSGRRSFHFSKLMMQMNEGQYFTGLRFVSLSEEVEIIKYIYPVF